MVFVAEFMDTESVYRLSDLKNWNSGGAALAVIGHPIAHSLSPAMHNAALSVMASADQRFGNWRYFKFDIAPEGLPAALPLFHDRGFVGINLTIPHKVIAVDLVRQIDPSAAEAAAVNTLRRLDNGFEGFNTDGHGISQAVAEDLRCPLVDTPVVLLGAGGAARGAAVTCLRERCRELWIGNRTATHLDALLAALAPVAARFDVPVRGFDLAHPAAMLPSNALVINATSAGLKPGDSSPIDLTRLTGSPRVYDMIYNPPATPLLRQSQALGLPFANGLSMLVHQGARALELWTGRPAPVAVMREACLCALSRTSPNA